VADELANAPLVLGVAMGLAFPGERFRDAADVRHLLPENGENVFLGHERNVASVKRGILARVGPARLHSTPPVST
jgi:hypothetical protein